MSGRGPGNGERRGSPGLAVGALARRGDRVRTGAGSSLSTGDGVVHDGAGEPMDPDGHVVPESRIHFRTAR